VINYLKEKPIRFLIVPAISFYLAVFIGFGFVVQNEYRLSWTYQKQFWSEILPLIRDASENEIVLVGATDLPETTQIEANSWNVPRLLNQIYIMPEAWENPPRVYRLLPDWEKSILTPEGKLKLELINVAAPPSLYGEFEPDRVIFIDWNMDKSQLIRRINPLMIAGVTLNVLPPGEDTLSDLPKGLLYYLLFD